MDPSSALASLLAEVPSLGRFLGLAAPLILVTSAAPFAIRRLRGMAWLRTNLDASLGILLAVILLGMVFLSALQILLRNLFDAGLLWIDPLLRHLVLVLAFVGAIAATGRKRHVQINVLGRLLRGTAARASGAVVAALAGVISLSLAHAGLLLLRDEIGFVETLFLGVPSWAILAVFPIAFLVLAYRFGWLLFLEIAGEAPRAPEVEMDLPERAT